MISLTERVQEFTKENIFHISDINDPNDRKNTIVLKQDYSNYVFNFPECPHTIHNITFELESGKLICTCGCFDCVIDRNFTWGSSIKPPSTCLDFDDHKTTIESTWGTFDNPGEIISGVFPCNGSVDGRELTDEELLAKIINRLEWRSIHDKMNPDSWLIKSVEVIKNNIPERCKALLRNIIGDIKYEGWLGGYNSYILVQADINKINELAQRSVFGILPPHINFFYNDPFTEWERSKVREANALFLSEDMKEIIDVIDTKKELCINLMETVQSIKNNINNNSYIQLLSYIKQLYEL